MAAPDRVGRPAEEAAMMVLRYLAATDAPPCEPADVVIGFGVFDLELPRFCADLYARGLAKRIVFTGGLGAGTGDLGGPEADVWRAETRRTHPDIPDSAYVIENRSTNTAENIAFTAARLAEQDPALAFGRGIHTAIVVASPSRLRRVALTLRKMQPGLVITRLLPPVDFAAQRELYERQGVNYHAHLAGELERLATYPARGWIVAEPLPPRIVAAGALLATGGEHAQAEGSRTAKT